MRIRLLIVSLCMFVMTGCAARARSVARAAADPVDKKVIVHIVSQEQTVTVTSSPQGLLYSLKDARGNVMIADASETEFGELQPELFRNIKHYIAVQNDEAPLPSADLQSRPIPTAIHYADR